MKTKTNRDAPYEVRVLATHVVKETKPITTRDVNKALKAAGIKAELVRNRSGYHYFTGEDIPMGVSDGIYIYRTADNTVAEWLKEARGLIGTSPSIAVSGRAHP